MDDLCIIDGHNMLFKAFAVQYKFYSKQNNIPLHVVNTYLNLVKKAVHAVPGKEFSNLVIVFDTPTRHDKYDMFAGYKANRTEDYSLLEDHPFIHLPYIQTALGKTKITFTQIEYIEGDEVVATIAHKWRVAHPVSDVYIVSNDSDFYQLLDTHTHMLLLSWKGNEIINPAFLYNKLGVTPKEYILFKSLTGDASDNIKGIPGIGPVRARKIIQKEMPFDFETCREIIERNIQLITLRIHDEIILPIENFVLDLSLLQQPNSYIFDLCNF